MEIPGGHVIDFESTGPQIIAHPQYEGVKNKILEGLKGHDLSNHFILFSSGTTGGALKGYAISKDALFTNADAVNKHFHLSQDDVWGLSLPNYHIGGLSVIARAYLLQNRVIDVRGWEPHSWLEKIQEVTITTIVPTQLYDLVKLGLKAPKNLRFIVVGGDFLSSELKKKAMELGWPVIRTFGMSEVCSQLASARRPEDDEIQVMPIHQIKTNNEGRLMVKSKALFTLEFRLEDKLKITLAEDLCQDGFYLTSDKVEIDGNTIKHLGRMGDEVKIAGHLVNLLSLKNILGNFLVQNNIYGKMEITIQDDERKGKKLILLIQKDVLPYLPHVKEILLPVKIDEVIEVKNFNRTDLGKLKRN